MLVSIVKAPTLLSHSLHNIRSRYSCCMRRSRSNTVLDFPTAQDSFILGLSCRVHFFLCLAFSAIFSPVSLSALFDVAIHVKYSIVHPMLVFDSLGLGEQRVSLLTGLVDLVPR